MNKPAPRRATPSKNTRLWDMLTIATLVITACVAAYFMLVFVNPNTGLNPLSPLNAAKGQPPTPTITPLGLPATWTPSATPYIPPTDTPRPTFTPVFTPTLFSLVPPTKTPKPTATPKSPYGAKIDYISSGLYHPESGCNILWVAGIVLDKNNSHHVGLQVLLLGSLNGKTVNIPMISGISPQLYGTSGFEFQLDSAPIDTRGTVYLQLRDQSGAVQLSENIYINTYADCNKNMTYIRFAENK